MRKVLVVDDDKSYTELLQDSLQSDDYKILTAHDGKEGLQKALDDRPDLILLDVIMPVMDGLTMMENLRLDEGYGSKVKAIFLTNLKSNNVIRNLLDLQTPHYLIKTEVKMDTLKQLVSELLEERVQV